MPNTPSASEAILRQLHADLAENLRAKLAGGSATAADLNVIRQFLKDNGIDATPTENSPLDKLAKSLPFVENYEDAMVN